MPSIIKKLLRKLIGCCEPATRQTSQAAPELPPVVVIEHTAPTREPAQVEVTTSCPLPPAASRTPSPEPRHERHSESEEISVPPSPPASPDFPEWIRRFLEEDERIWAERRKVCGLPPPIRIPPLYMAWRRGEIPGVKIGTDLWNEIHGVED